MEKDVKQVLAGMESRQKEINKKLNTVEMKANNGNYTYTEPKKEKKQ